MMIEVMSNANVKVLVSDQTIDGVPHSYDILFDPGELESSGFDQAITLDFAFRDIPGVTEEALLAVVNHRLGEMEKHPNNKLEHKEAMFYVGKALECLRRMN